MARLHGISGFIVFANGYTTNAGQWSLSPEIDAEETAAFGDAWVGIVTGLKRASGTYAAEVDDTVGFTIGDLVGDTGAATFTMIAGYTLTMSIVIVSSDLGADVTAGPQTVTFNFRVDGAVEVNGPGTPS